MNKKLRNAVLLCLFIALIGGAGYIVKNHLQKSGNAAAVSSGDNKANVKTYSNFKGLDFEKENISLSFEGKSLNLTLPVYADNNRYYLPLTEIIDSINGKINIRDGIANVEINNYQVAIYTKENYFTVNGEKFNLKKKTVVSGDVVYISLFDLKKMLNLKVDWDEDKNSIGLFWNRDKIVENKQPESGKAALVRFEDVTAAQRYATPESLEKLRIIFDYCYSRGIPMQLGWIPRYIDEKNNIDNDSAEKYSMHNADFVYTLDYFVDKNGLVGLHGYTHQYGDEVSIEGIEFNGKHNASAESVKQRLGYAISDAKKLEIPITFFESPHYAALPYQKKIIEQYFDNIYEYRISEKEKNITKVDVGGRTVKYVPTPLNYVDGPEDTDHMIAKIKALGRDTLGSFFYHPSIEFDFIKITKDSTGYPSYEYSGESPIHRIINTFIEEGYMFKDINSL